MLCQFSLKLARRFSYSASNISRGLSMPEPSHTAAAVALSGVGAGTLSAMFGLDTGALFWAFLGAVCSRTIQPRISDKGDMIKASGLAIISTVLGTLGSVWAAPTALSVGPFLATVEPRALIALPAFLLGLLGHEILLRVIDVIREFKKGAL
jgi:hypothetical protein